MVSPYLTEQGKWLFAVGVAITLVGVVVRQPVIVLFGQIPAAVLLVAAARLLPAARSLDRRCANFSVEPDKKAHPAVQLRRRGRQAMTVWLNNGGSTSLVVRRLVPYLSGAVEVDAATQRLRVDAGRAASFDVDVRSDGVGRASLQGFDVEIVDRWGLVAARDYLPCVQRFETYPSMGRVRSRGGRRRSSLIRPSRGRPRSSRSGTAVRELRDFQPGDPLRSIAWKATVRQRRLIAREFDDERTRSEYLALDISSSMRAGIPSGRKFDHAIAVAARLADTYLGEGREVGMWTFDESVYGEVRSGLGVPQLQRIQEHLVELRSVIDAERTALSEEELQEALADYLLVQERLDFRHGQGLDGQVDAELLRSWLKAMTQGEAEKWNVPAAPAGVVRKTASVVRRFFRLRGIELDPPSEVRPGTKVLGIQEVIQTVITVEGAGGRLTIISDLCGLNDVDLLKKSINLARRRGLKVRVLAPFSPGYTDEVVDVDGGGGGLRRLLRGTKQRQRARRCARLVRDLFARAEYRDRGEVARSLQALGVEVQFIGPSTLGEVGSPR